MKTFKKIIKPTFIIFMLCLILTLQAFAPAFLCEQMVFANPENEEIPSRIIVSLGDSYSAGEGIPPFYGQTGTIDEKIANPDWLSHRSEKCWPGKLTLPDVSGEMADHRNENWYFVATSGALTNHLNNPFTKNYNHSKKSGSLDIHPQIEVFNMLGDKKAEYVTLTLGGNDARFSEVVTQAISSTFSSDTSSLTSELDKIWTDFYKEGGIRDKLRQSYTDISNAAGPQAKIIVAGYPKLLSAQGNFIFSKDVAALVNNAVSRFNKEINALVNDCKASGMKITFVSVEEEFDGHEAYTSDPYINGIVFSQDEDINQGLSGIVSAYSIHPNEKGADAYARCVQRKIDSIEADNGASEWPGRENSSENEVVLLLNSSDSTKNNIDKIKNASKNFVSTITKKDASTAIVAYDNEPLVTSDFSKNEANLISAIDCISAGGDADVIKGIEKANELLSESTSRKKSIVIVCNDEYSEETKTKVKEISDNLKSQGIYIYTIGLLSHLSEKSDMQSFIESVASEACHYEIDNDTVMNDIFSDIASQIRGEKYMYIRIDGPADVKAVLNGEVLSSKDNAACNKASYGTISFEEKKEKISSSTDDRIKILRLKQSEKYEIYIDATAGESLNYTIGFMDDNGIYSDVRRFENIRINSGSKIYTVAELTKTTIIQVDENGDGTYDSVYSSTGTLSEEAPTGSEISPSILGMVVPVVTIIPMVAYMIIKLKSYKSSDTFIADEEIQINKKDKVIK